MNLVSLRSRYSSGIEALESRIAPARVILVGAPDLPNKADTNYNDLAAADGGPGFVDTEVGGLAGDPISVAVGPGVVGAADTFYFRLSKGDVLQLYTGQDQREPLLTVNSGNVVAFFVDGNGDHEVQQAELVSLALGKDASIILRSGVSGDIVTNLNEQGTPSLADDTLNMTDLVSTKQGIKGVFIGGGGVTGNILSGGNVTNVQINGGIQSILAGSAAAGAAFDFFPGVVGGNGTLTGVAGIVPGPGEMGSSITGVTLNADLIGKIQSGDGGAGAKGGILSQVVVTTDTNGFTLQSGKGGDAAGAKKNGGDGGGLSGIYVAGRPDGTSNSLISLVAGAGGASTLDGKGGGGGGVSLVYVGFQFVGGKPIPTTDVLADDVQIFSGAGGVGKTGGNAGSIKAVRVTVAPTANAAGDEIQVVAGVGGNSNVIVGGKTGAGGSIEDVDLRIATPTVGVGAPGLGQKIRVEAGDAGVAAGAGGAAKGGSVTKVTLLGADHAILAGDGSTGKSGGDGGILKTISIIEGDGVLAHNVQIEAGRGGAGAAGNGGKGGDLLDFRIVNG
ncbi:MAG: hypothetical protein WCF18_00020, partial [Chthoniobacteraceae bacterium]